MDSRDTIRAVRTDNGQIGHPNFAPGVLVHQAHSLKAPVIPRKTTAHLIEQPAVDFIDNLEMPGKYDLKPPERPLLQCLRQERVIRVSKGVFRNRPRLIPSKPRLIEQNAHQLWYSHRRMCVVQLECGFLGENVPIVIAE